MPENSATFASLNHALVVDDDPQISRFVARVLQADGWVVEESSTAARAFELIDAHPWSLVVCDVMLGEESGFDVLRAFRLAQPEAQIVLMTGNGSAVDAMDATALGAYDYLLKPFGVRHIEDLSEAMRRRFQRRRQTDTDVPVKTTRASALNLIGTSPALVNVMKMVGRLAATSLPVLITGESGTGKEVLVRAIHGSSARAARPFVAVNCGAIPAELIESELFGHLRGSFTGADRDRPGLFEEADGGTVFLDEITETTPAFQVKLLRVLQEGEVRRVGSNRPVQVDVRVIAATNRDPKTEAREGRFRQDLLYRLNTVGLHLPPLRERKEDILPLARHFARRLQQNGERVLRFSPEAVRLLEQYPWPGNVRELENSVMHAAAICQESVRPEDLPDDIRDYASPVPEQPATPEPSGQANPTSPHWVSLEEWEGGYVTRVMEHTGGNKLAAARILKVDRKTIDRMLTKHNIEIKTTHQASQTGKPRA